MQQHVSIMSSFTPEVIHMWVQVTLTQKVCGKPHCGGGAKAVGFLRAFLAVLASSLLSWHNLGRSHFPHVCGAGLSGKWNKLHYCEFVASGKGREKPCSSLLLSFLFFFPFLLLPSHSLMSFLPL